MEGDDRRMGNLADDASFLDELVTGRAAGQFRRQELNGNKAADHGIKSARDAAIGASADDFENLVTADLHGGLSLRQMDS